MNQMKTSIISDEISQDLEVVAEIATKHRLDALELRSVWNKAPHELSDNDVNKIKTIIQNTGLKICSISSPFFKCDYEKAEIENHLKMLEKLIYVAQQLDCKIIRGFSFWRDPNNPLELSQIAQAFKIPGKMLMEANIRMALESDPSVNTCNGRLLSELIDIIDHPNIKALWDPGNDLFSPVKEKPYPDGFHFVEPHFIHVHVKDAVLTPSGAQCVKIGTGLVDWKNQLKALKLDGYDGYLSLETHYRKDSVLSEEMMKRPGGSAFSESGFESSIECILVFKNLLESI